MASLDMKGPFELDKAKIDEQVTKTSAGNYALGRVDEDGKFLVGYVGRADSNINQRLKHWADNSRRPKFKFSYASSPKAAFEKECHNYHDFDPPGNDIHPDSPSGIDRACPVCGSS